MTTQVQALEVLKMRGPYAFTPPYEFMVWEQRYLYFMLV
jgi:hypothetical protein